MLRTKIFLNCKIFVWLGCLTIDPPAIYSMKQITLARQGLALLGFFPICNIIFLITDQRRYCFTSVIRPWFSNIHWFWATQRLYPGFPTGVKNMADCIPHHWGGRALQNLIGEGLSQYMGEAKGELKRWWKIPVTQFIC